MENNVEVRRKYISDLKSEMQRKMIHKEGIIL